MKTYYAQIEVYADDGAIAEKIEIEILPHQTLQSRVDEIVKSMIYKQRYDVTRVSLIPERTDWESDEWIVSKRSVNGTSFREYIRTSYLTLEMMFGKPIDVYEDTMDGKVTTEWVLENRGEIITIYDWKATDYYDSDLPSVTEFRAEPSYEWHIGARSHEAAERFIAWFKTQVEECE